MLEIINTLTPFFEDCYREIGVREYSRITKISAPTASKMLKEYEKDDLLKMREERGFLLFRGNRDSFVLRDLSRIYWKERLSNLIDCLNKEINYPTIILFGSLSKLETKDDSDIDLAILTKSKGKIDVIHLEKVLKKKIQIFRFGSLSSINSKELKTNILNGYIVQGGFS